MHLGNFIFLKFCSESPLFKCTCDRLLKTGVRLQVFRNTFAQSRAPRGSRVSEGAAPLVANTTFVCRSLHCSILSSPLPSFLFILKFLFFKYSLRSLLFCFISGVPHSGETIACFTKWPPPMFPAPAWPTRSYTLSPTVLPTRYCASQDVVSISPQSCQFASLLAQNVTSLMGGPGGE